MNKINYVSQEVAILANEKGFNEPCEYCYDPQCININNLYVYWEEIQCSTRTRNNRLVAAPTQTELKRWLRERYNCYVVNTVEFYKDGVNNLVQVWFYDPKNEDHFSNYCTDKSSGQYGDNNEYKTPEEAIEYGLLIALQRI
jgi:hypothetical protein